MQSKRKLLLEVSLIEAMGELVQTYEEIYVSKIQHVRDTVVGTRYFIEGLTTIFKELKLAYGQQIVDEARKHRKGNDLLTAGKHSGEVVVLITTSKRLSGDINQKVFNYFMDYITSRNVQLVIVGQIGKELYEQRDAKKQYTFFDLPEDALSFIDMQAVVEYLLQFEKVTVFHGRYKNLMVQHESKESLTGEYELVGSGAPSEEVKKEISRFLFEPGPREILDFFEKHVFAALFKQSTHESTLAEIGSRIVAMEAATGNIEKKLRDLEYSRKKMIKRKKNKRQLQALAGQAFWNVRR